MNKQKKYVILGMRLGHDASAALIIDGQIIADVSEERFNRVKHSADPILNCIEYCLKTGNISIDDVDEIALADKETIGNFKAIFGLDIPHENKPDTTHSSISRFRKALFGTVTDRENSIYGVSNTPIYLRKFFLKKLPKVTVVEHHLAHAAAAYYSSNDKDKMIIATMDGTGDGFSSCIWLGQDGKISPLMKYGKDSSLGWFYSIVTESLGWWQSDVEGKTMGLAPYGDNNKCKGSLDEFYPKFKDGRLVRPYLFPPYQAFMQSGAYHWHSPDALKILERVKEFGRENIAAEAQFILEEQVMEFVLPWLEREKTGILATGGGLFLNVKLNQRIWMSGKVSKHYPYANPGDSGLAVGAALYAASQNGILTKKISSHLYWGPEFSNAEIENVLKIRGITYRKSNDISLEAAKYLVDDKIIAWFQGRMEAGPRALGNRSILMSPKKKENKDTLNARVKFREGFRPFCPSMLDEAKDRYLVNPRSERYMITSFDCKKEAIHELPAVVHVDGTLRPQTVTREDNPLYHKLIQEFGRMTGTPVVLNTSFNVRGEPIVCSPSDALRCFYDSGIDVLVMGNYIIEKTSTPER